MLIRVSDQTLVDDLCVHFRRSGFTAESVGGGMVEVTQSDVHKLEQERAEIGAHARVWEAMHPEAALDLL